MVRSPEWRAFLARYRWLDRYLAGAAFERFVAAEEGRVRGILTKLGLDAPASAAVSAMAYPAVVLAGAPRAYSLTGADATLRSEIRPSAVSTDRSPCSCS